MRIDVARSDRPEYAGVERASQPDAIASLYRENFQFVWRSLRRLGVADRSLDDAVQDVFLVAHRKLSEYEGRASHRGWLFGIARHMAREYRRRDGRLALDELALSRAAGPTRDIPELRRQVDLLDHLLSALQEDQRAVFVMAEIEGFSAPEIAEVLGIKLNTAYSRLRLARSRFERALSRHRKQTASEVKP